MSVSVFLPDDELVRPEPGLIHRLYPIGNPGDFGYLFGYYGSKKTWYALYRAICIAAGIEFFGYKTQQRFTAYYAAENHKSIRVRARCIQEHLGLDRKNLPFIIIPNHGDLKEQTNRANLASTILRFTEKWGPCGLLELDTVTEAFSIQDENAPREWLDIQHACRELGQAIGGCVDAIHHTGKDTSRGGRGSSAIGGSHDFSVTAEKQANGSSTVGYGVGDKMRDVNDRDYPKIAFRVERYVIDAAQDVFGDPWSSGYPVPCDVVTDQPTVNRNARDQALHDAFNDVAGVFVIDVPDIGKRNGKPLEKVRHHFMNRYVGNGDAGKHTKNSVWSRLVGTMRDGEHDEYRTVDNGRMVIKLAIDEAAVFDFPVGFQP
jgi:hypothetical protein